jgi:membrane-bound serine protease (ClpP class)
MDGIALPILLLVIGVIAFFLEAFIPSSGLITVIGLGCVIGSVATAFGVGEGSTTGLVFLALAVILAPASLIAAFTLLPKTPIGKRLMLRTSQKKDAGYVAQSKEEAELLGKSGVTVSMLRPSGEAKIDGRRYDVMTEGEMIEKDTPVEVRRVEGNRIVVRAQRPDAEET